MRPFRSQLPPEIFSSAYSLPVSDAHGNNRRSLQEAANLLKPASFKLNNKKLINPKTGSPLVLKVINDYPQIEPTLVYFKKNLEVLGIQLKIKTIDNTQYIRRIRDFDFDIANWNYHHERIPGKELITQFGSASAHKKGSMNISGISNPAIDHLISLTEQAKTSRELTNILNALDRVLLWGNYVIPKWNMHKGARIAHRKELKHPEIDNLNWLEMST